MLVATDEPAWKTPEADKEIEPGQKTGRPFEQVLGAVMEDSEEPERKTDFGLACLSIPLDLEQPPDPPEQAELTVEPPVEESDDAMPAAETVPVVPASRLILETDSVSGFRESAAPADVRVESAPIEVTLQTGAGFSRISSPIAVPLPDTFDGGESPDSPPASFAGSETPLSDPVAEIPRPPSHAPEVPEHAVLAERPPRFDAGQAQAPSPNPRSPLPIRVAHHAEPPLPNAKPVLSMRIIDTPPDRMAPDKYDLAPPRQALGSAPSAPKQSVELPPNAARSSDAVPGSRESRVDSPERAVAEQVRPADRVETPVREAPRRHDTAPTDDQPRIRAGSIDASPAALVHPVRSGQPSVLEAPGREPSATNAVRTEPQGGLEPRVVESHRETPLREISLRVTEDSRERVEVRVVEQSGELRIGVRARDEALAGRLWDDLPELVGRLKESGFEAETWRPSSSDMPEAPLRRDERAQGAGMERNPDGQHRSGWQQGEEGGRRRNPREAERPEEGFAHGLFRRNDRREE